MIEFTGIAIFFIPTVKFDLQKARETKFSIEIEKFFWITIKRSTILNQSKAR